MLRTLGILCIAAVFGVMAATTSACVIGLATGTNTWCGLPLIWFVGFPVAIVFAIVLGLPAALIFRKFHLTRWWQFSIGGALIAGPFWLDLAQPFASARWQQSGFFDSLIYLGSGTLAGLFFWWLSAKLRPKLSNPAVNTDAPQAARRLP